MLPGVTASAVSVLGTALYRLKNKVRIFIWYQISCYSYYVTAFGSVVSKMSFSCGVCVGGGGGGAYIAVVPLDVTSSVSTCKRLQRSNIGAFRHPGATAVCGHRAMFVPTELNGVHS